MGGEGRTRMGGGEGEEMGLCLIHSKWSNFGTDVHLGPTNEEKEHTHFVLSVHCMVNGYDNVFTNN